MEMKLSPVSRRWVRVALVLGALCVLMWGVTANSSAAPRADCPSKTIYLLWPNVTTPAWPTYYIPAVLNNIKQQNPGYQIKQSNANNSQATQLSQVEAAIAAKACLVLLSPPVPTQAGGELKALHQAGIPTIAYLNDPDGGPVYAYLWVDFAHVGEAWGQYLKQHLVTNVGHTPVRLAEIYGDPTFQVYFNWLKGVTPTLNQLIKSGKVTVVCKANTPGWDPTTAQTHMEQCLTKTGNGVDAVLTMNDSTSDGVAAALASQGVLGKVKIYGGHDGDLTTVQRVLLGQQIGTFHADGKELGRAAGALVKAALAGKSAQSTGYINGTFNNHYVKGGVPTVLAKELMITSSNVQQQIVGLRIFTKSQICTGSAAQTSFCTK
jgi:D-xylose transport system substrate-binding protein